MLSLYISMRNQTCCRVLFNQHVALTMRSSQMTTAAVLALKLGLLEGFIGSFWDKTCWFDLSFFWVQLLIGNNTALGTLPDMTFYSDLWFLYRMQNGSVGWTWGVRIIDTVSSLWGFIKPPCAHPSNWYGTTQQTFQVFVGTCGSWILPNDSLNWPTGEVD